MYEWTAKHDMWVRCENGTWVRWSHVKAVTTEDNEIVLVQDNRTWVYWKTDSPEKTHEMVEQLLQKLSGHYG